MTYPNKLSSFGTVDSLSIYSEMFLNLSRSLALLRAFRARFV